MIERKFKDAEGPESVRFSHGEFGFVVQALEPPAGEALLGHETVSRSYLWASPNTKGYDEVRSYRGARTRHTSGCITRTPGTGPRGLRSRWTASRSKHGCNGFNFTYGLNPSGLPMSYGPGLSISNGFAGVSQTLQDLGPFRGQDYLADLARIVGHHTLGAGLMWYRLHANTTSYSNTIAYTQNATAQGATAGPSGYGPASFLLATPDNISAYAGNLNEDMTNSWTALYFQDQWKALKNLTIAAGLRWDYAAPPNPHKTFSGLDWNTGIFDVSQSVPPLLSCKGESLCAV